MSGAEAEPIANRDDLDETAAEMGARGAFAAALMTSVAPPTAADALNATAVERIRYTIDLLAAAKQERA